MQTSDQRVTGRGGDSTVVLSVLGDEDVAFVSPVFTPAGRRREKKKRFKVELCKKQGQCESSFFFFLTTHLFFTIQNL